MQRLLVILGLMGSFFGVQLQAQLNARLMREPDVSQDRIAFVYAGDIWTVAKSGGLAQRLSSPEGEERRPRFSPDGSMIAFSANYDGNIDIYVLPTLGGVPTRVTHHPESDRIVDWYPDGQSLLLASFRESGRDRFSQFFKVANQGGLPEKLPLAYGAEGAISQDGRYLAYTPHTRASRTWKRYRGGWAADVWVFDLQAGTATNITDSPANDEYPMWHGRTVYFLSDRGAEQRFNLWAYDLDQREVRQVTNFEDFDVHVPSAGPSDIVFEAGGRLYLLELPAERLRQVEVQVVTDLRSLKPRREKVARYIEDAEISPTGKRALIEARGEIFSLPAEEGAIRNFSQTPGSAERSPSWSPDGRTVAFWSDRTGEYELVLRSASGDEEVVTSLGPGFRYHTYWSPDSKKLAFIDQDQQIQLFDVESREVQTVDRTLRMSQGGLDRFRVSWSGDSRWMAYSRSLEDAPVSALFLYDTREGSLHQVTHGYYDDARPVFDPDGKYLYLLTNRTLTPSYSDLDNTWIYANTTNVAAVPLRKDVASPLAPREDSEPVKEEPKPETEEKSDSEQQPSEEAEPSETSPEEKKEKGTAKAVEIDLEGFESRLVILPPEAGNYSELAASPGKVFYLRRPRTGASEDVKSDLVFFDLKERKEQKVLSAVDGFELSADGKKLLVLQSRSLAIIDAKPNQKADKKLRTADMEAVVDPRAEWRQIFADAWRFERDFFYDPQMHGVDWEAMRERYGALIDGCATRWDVNFVLGELIGELNASHAYRGGGDTESGPERRVGMLGVDWSLQDGAYRVARIVRGGPWDAEARSPLAEPGVEVQEGDYVLAVNGLKLDPSKDPWAAFEGLAGETVALTVNDRPELEGAREVLVKTLSSEDRLRYLDWIETKRRKVDELSSGRIGYIYVPSTGRGGQTELVRQFHAQFSKPGLIIDDRFNSGGQIPDRFVELLDRETLNYWAIRSGKDARWPPVAHDGPKAMLINGLAGSGGDAFPLYFRLRGLGPLVGTRTWGGLIGISGSPPLIDGGRVTVPTFRMYGTDGEWFAEGYGVPPDIQVEDDQAALAKGRDVQLERAVEEVLRRLEENPPKEVPRPPYEDRTRAPAPPR